MRKQFEKAFGEVEHSSYRLADGSAVRIRGRIDRIDDSGDGHVTVIKAGQEYEMLSENDLGEPISASPVFANGTLYLRSFDALWAIKNK